MNQKYFSVPADFKLETLEQIDALNQAFPNAKVTEVYGQVTDFRKFNSGRSAELLPPVTLKELDGYLQRLRQAGLEFNYTMNPSCIGNQEFSEKGAAEIMRFLKQLANSGVTIITVAMPSLIELIQASGCGFQIKASTICQISSANKALYYKNLGVRRVVLDEDITRKFDRIQEICKAFGPGVEMIVNSGCYKDCPYKMFHYNHESHTQQDRAGMVTNYYYHRCTAQKARDLRNMIKLNWIRPEDLTYYQQVGVNYFKIQGRHSVLKGDLLKALGYYMSEQFQGNLVDLLTLFTQYNAFPAVIDNRQLNGFVAKFFTEPNFCKDNCSACNYCFSFAQKSINRDQSATGGQILEFYDELDDYRRMLKQAASQSEPESTINKYRANFDF